MPLERSIIPGIQAIFLRSSDELELAPAVDPETFATAIAWAIYGAASRWAQTSDRKPADQMAESIAFLVRPFFEKFVPPDRSDSSRAVLTGLPIACFC